MSKTEFPSLVHLFQSKVAALGPQRALVYKSEGKWKEYSWSDWCHRAYCIAQALENFGVKPGDRVGILSENRPEWLFADQGILHAGALDVPIYTTSIPSQVAYILQDAQVQVAFVSKEEQLQKLVLIQEDVPFLKLVVHFDDHMNGSSKLKTRFQVISFREFLSRGENFDRKKREDVWKKVTGEDLATLIYTSGTTGNPKGVMLTHNNLISNALCSCDHLSSANIEKDPLYFSFLPLSHALERTAGYYVHLAWGIPIAFAESIERVPDNLAELSPTRFCAVPRIFEKMHAKILEKVQSASLVRRSLFFWALRVGMDYRKKRMEGRATTLSEVMTYQAADRLVFHKIRKILGGRVTFMVSGGGPLAPEIAAFFDAMGLLILQGYGLTEAAPVVSCNVLQSYRYDTVGLPLPGVQIRLAEDGEILVSGPNVMKGYYNRPKDSEEVLRDGWLYTGDVGMLDANGQLKITDRKKDIIVTAGGKHASPQNIENRLKLSPYIEQVCVIGDRRKYVSSLIVPNFPGLRAYAKEKGLGIESDEELIDHQEVLALIQREVDEVNSGLAPYESIRKFTLLTREFSPEAGEITPTLKVKRKVVETHFADVIEKMY